MNLTECRYVALLRVTNPTPRDVILHYNTGYFEDVVLNKGKGKWGDNGILGYPPNIASNVDALSDYNIGTFGEVVLDRGITFIQSGVMGEAGAGNYDVMSNYTVGVFSEVVLDCGVGFIQDGTMGEAGVESLDVLSNYIEGEFNDIELDQGTFIYNGIIL